MSTPPPLSVPLVNAECSSARESVLQMCDSLRRLDAAAAIAMGRIGRRAERNAERAEEVHRRIAVLREKVRERTVLLVLALLLLLLIWLLFLLLLLLLFLLLLLLLFLPLLLLLMLLLLLLLMLLLLLLLLLLPLLLLV